MEGPGKSPQGHGDNVTVPKGGKQWVFPSAEVAESPPQATGAAQMGGGMGSTYTEQGLGSLPGPGAPEKAGGRADGPARGPLTGLRPCSA